MSHCHFVDVAAGVGTMDQVTVVRALVCVYRCWISTNTFSPNGRSRHSTQGGELRSSYCSEGESRDCCAVRYICWAHYEQERSSSVPRILDIIEYQSIPRLKWTTTFQSKTRQSLNLPGWTKLRSPPAISNPPILRIVSPPANTGLHFRWKS